LGYGEASGSPMVAGDDGTSWVEVDIGERSKEVSKSKLERLASGTLARRSSSMVQLRLETA
jgi:hypothetical protein